LKNPNPLKDVKALDVLVVAVLFLVRIWGSLSVVIHPLIESKA